MAVSVPSAGDPLGGHDLSFTGTGQLLVTHSIAECDAPCPVHEPSAHHMRTWPTHWDPEGRVIFRICAHGVAHPDPDDIIVRTVELQILHLCDGCCVPQLASSE